MKTTDKHIIEVAQFNEMPLLSINIRKTLQDFVTEDIDLFIGKKLIL